MSLNGLQPKEKEFLILICNKGPIHGYALHSGPEAIMSSSYWNKTKKHLSNLNLIEFKKEIPSSELRGRDIKLYGLTFKGLLYCLNQGFIEYSKAHEIRKSHFIPLPKESKGFPHQYMESYDKEFLDEMGITINLPDPNEYNFLINPDNLNNEWEDIKLEIEKDFSEDIYKKIVFDTNLNTYEQIDIFKIFYDALYNQIMIMKNKQRQAYIKKYPNFKKIIKKLTRLLLKSISIK